MSNIDPRHADALAQLALMGQHPDPVSAPDAATWRAFLDNRLGEADTENVMRWLLSNPEAYQQWLSSPSNQRLAAKADIWQRLREWFGPVAWGSGLAMACGLLIVVVLQFNQADGVTRFGGGAYADLSGQMNPAQRQQLGDLLLPWESENATLGFSPASNNQPRNAFARGLIDTRRELSGQTVAEAQSDLYYQLGRWNLLLAAARSLPPAALHESAFWSQALHDAQALRQDLAPLEEQEAKLASSQLQALEAPLRALISNAADARARHRLGRRLQQFREALSPTP